MSKKLTELQAKRSELINQASQIQAKASDETPLSDEDFKAATDALDAVKATDEEIKAEQARLNRAAELHNRLTELKSQPDNPVLRAMVANPQQIGAGMFAGHTGEFKIPRNVRRVPVRNFVEDANSDVDPQVRAYRFGMWAISTIGKCLPQYANPKADAAVRDMGLWNIAHGEGNADTTGSHVLVPDEFGTDLIYLRERFGVARTAFMLENMTSDTKTVPRQLGGLTANFTAESTAISESNLTFDNITLVARKLTALARISNELNADSAIGLGDLLAGYIAEAWANKEDDCGFNGTGTSAFGGMTGVLTQLGTLTAGTAPGLIQGAGNSWSALTLANFHSLIGALPQYADTGRAAFYCHKTFAYSVMQRLALASGGVTGTEVFQGRRVLTFLGYPVVISQMFPSVSASQHIPVVFGDLSLGAKFGYRIGSESIAFSDQATVGGESMWERDQIGVRGTERFDIVVHDFGSNSVAGPICGLRTT